VTLRLGTARSGRSTRRPRKPATPNVVVDTGPWILGRKVVIPAGAVERIDVDDRTIFVALTKDQIKDSPEYDPAQFDEGYRTRLGTYYDPYLH
jgi:hypothetical protein